jgi:hypothetical protein
MLTQKWQQTRCATTTNFYDGICFLKAIINETYTKDLNNVAVARSNSATLTTYMKTLNNSDITEFLCETEFTRIGSSQWDNNDLFMNLFNGYQECKDKCFQDWITRTKDDWLFQCKRWSCITQINQKLL